jgi:hypothetical protein
MEEMMKKLMLALAAAGVLLVGGVAAASPLRLAQVDVRVGDDYGYRGERGERGERRDFREEREFRRGPRASECRTVTIRERRGDEVVVRRIQRC